MLSPILIGYLVDITGSFNAAFNFMIGCMVVSMGMAMTFRTRTSETD